MTDAGYITVSYANTANMLADGFTKPLTKDRYMDHAARIGLGFTCQRKQPCCRTSTASPYLYNQPNGNSLNVMLATTYFLKSDGL